MCERWMNSFEAFLEDMGERPEGASLERIDNEKGYEPGNCKWATWLEQSRNRRDNVFVEFEGRRYILKDLASALGVDYKRLHNWYRTKKLPLEEAIARCR